MILIPALLLLTLGVVVIYTSDQTLAIQQLLFGAFGILMYVILQGFDYRFTKTIVNYLYLISIILLIITFILGFETRGSIRWIPLGIFNLQPSEFAKPVIIMILANFWATHAPSWKNIFKSFLILLPVAGLIFRQPDLGTTLTVVFIWFVMLVASNISLFKLSILGLAGMIITPLGWYSLQDYQKQRISSFLSPASDPKGIGFHVIQSMIAVGSGQFTGRGLGRGTQSRLQFLPEFRTDFIFAFIAEELGFIGSFIVLFLYASFFFLCFKILNQVKDRYGELIIIGVMSMIFFQMAVNIGMNIGVLPITGITLPLLSYGGSSIITTFISLGLIASISRFGRKQKDLQEFTLTS